MDQQQPIPLDARKQEILKAVVADYTRTGIPVGSHALAVHLASWSSATIRSELANLVEIGYLLQPHTSAGRVPSDRGYRYYVDFLMEEEPVQAAIRRLLDPYFQDVPASMDGLLEIAATALARAADAVSIVTGPGTAGARLKHLDLVSLDDTHLLMMLVLEGNLIRQQAVEVPEATNQEALSTIAAEFNSKLVGKGGEEVAGAAAAESDSLRREIMLAIAAYLRAGEARQDTLIVHDGVRNLLRQPEFGDIARLQEVLEVLEEERILNDVLATLEVGAGLHIMIGRETGVEELRECSLVLTTYDGGDNCFGTLGVLGPTRMRYSQVAPRVRYVAQRVEQALRRYRG